VTLSSGLVTRLRAEVAQRLAARQREDRDANRPRLGLDEQQLYARRVANEVLEDLAKERLDAGGAVLTADEEDEYAQAIDDSLFGLGRLQRLLEDESIENINANGCDETWITRADGMKELGPPLANSDAELIDLIRMAAARMGLSERRFDFGSPRLNLQLPDGSRLFAVMGVVPRPSLSVRRHRYTKLFLEDLVGLGTIDAGMREFLGAAVRARKNIIVCGGTKSGKTTTLRALANEIPAHERLITIEDTLELGLDKYPDLHPDVVTLEEREENIEGEGAINAADLVRWGLRMDPDRVIVGEVRGAEVLPMLNAMSQGNDGSMCTIHANSSSGAFGRLAAYAVQSPERLPLEATNLLVANAIDFVVYVGQQRTEGRAIRRYVSSVREVLHAEGPMIVSNEIFRPGLNRCAVPGVPIRSDTVEELEAAGYDTSYFNQAEGWWQS
jgi:Flp pilus assembly CpaF family ATPase